MRLFDEGSTSSTLLRKVADWEDHPAWVRFRDIYDPRLRRWCRGYGLNADAIDEICQCIWIELAERMLTFEYDPSRSFRAWLWRLCQSRVLNFLHERSAKPWFSLDGREGGLAAGGRGDAGDPAGINEREGEERALDPFQLLMLAESEKVQAAVRARLKPHNWEAFWLVAVCDWSVERTGDALGMTKAAVYAARKRVADMLRDEGRRVMDQRSAGKGMRSL